MELRKRVRLWLPAILWSAFIFVLSSLPGADFSSNDGQNFLIRKSLHIVEYFILTLLFYRGSRNIAISVVLAIVYSVTDEFHQSLVPGRTGKVSDLVIDGISSFLAGIVLWKYYQNLPKKLTDWLSE